MEDDRLGVVQFQTCVPDSLLSLAFCLGTVALSPSFSYLFLTRYLGRRTSKGWLGYFILLCRGKRAPKVESERHHTRYYVDAHLTCVASDPYHADHSECPTMARKASGDGVDVVSLCEELCNENILTGYLMVRLYKDVFCKAVTSKFSVPEAHCRRQLQVIGC